MPREAELTIYLPQQGEAADLRFVHAALEALPGQVCWVPDPRRDTSGKLHVPTEAAGRLRPDAGTIALVGEPRRMRDGSYSVPPPLVAGDRVLTRPYKALWLSNVAPGVPELRFVPIGWHWSHCLPAVWRGGQWQPLADWLIVKRMRNDVLFMPPKSEPAMDPTTLPMRSTFGRQDTRNLLVEQAIAHSKATGGGRSYCSFGDGSPGFALDVPAMPQSQSPIIHIPNAGSKAKREMAEVIACGPHPHIRVGSRVLLDVHPNIGLGFRFGDLEGCELVKCVDEDGHANVIATT